MALNLENPYSKILDEISEASQLHRIEGNRIRRDVIDTKLEETVKKYANNPLISEIRSHSPISEDDQDLLDMNMFSTDFYKTKLDLSKEFEKENKKFDECALTYKNLVQQRITKFNLNASILSKFTEEELRKNTKLSKMANELPEGYEAAQKKFIKQDALVSKIYSNYISKNPEEFADKLYKFVTESKQFRADFIALKKAEIEALKEKAQPIQETANIVKKPINKDLFGSRQADFDFLRGVIKEEDKCSQEQLNELKSFISKVLDAQQLGAFTKLEEELSNEYQKLDSVEGIVAKRLQISLSQFNKGVAKIEDLIGETGTIEAFSDAVENLINKEVYQADLNELKHNPATLNLLVGYSARIKVYLNDMYNKTRKHFLGIRLAKIDPLLERPSNYHQAFVKFLEEKVMMNPDLLNSDMLSTMITDDKKDELAYELMNNAVAVSNSGDTLDWHDALNKILAHCILEIVASLENGDDYINVIEKYRDQYLSKEKEKVVEEKKEERIIKRSFATKQEQTNTIKNILR